MVIDRYTKYPFIFSFLLQSFSCLYLDKVITGHDYMNNTAGVIQEAGTADTWRAHRGGIRVQF